MLQQLTDWLSRTYLSAIFSDTTHLETWLIIPISQSIHILGIAMVMISVGILNLRLLGIAAKNRPFGDLVTRLMPWIWSGLLILLISGAVQTIAEPSRELLNGTFWAKMAMLAVAVAVTVLYQITVGRDPRYWELSADRVRFSKLLATFSLILWVGVLSAGRLIAYLDLSQGF